MNNRLEERVVGTSGSNGLSQDFSGVEGKRNFYQKVKDGAANYLVDVSAGISFYAPIMATGEHYFAGMTGPEVLKSRLGATAMQMICMRPIGMLRNAAAKYFGLTKNSQWYQKMASDVVSTLSVQLPTYALVLYFSGASFEEGKKALTLGALVTAVSGRVFGKYMDCWRKICGKKPAIK